LSAGAFAATKALFLRRISLVTVENREGRGFQQNQNNTGAPKRKEN
jgi:hypothetical protein